MPLPSRLTIPTRAGDPGEIDYSGTAGDDFDALSRDRIPVRSLHEDDLAALVAIDSKATRRNRSAYYARKLDEVMQESGVRVSLVAERDGRPVGFIMARVDFGEFGCAEPEAVIDTIGVDPDYRRRHVGSALMSQLLANLRTLQVDRVRTEVNWNDLSLLAYLDRAGFTPAQRIVLHRRVKPR
jgi:ribosomal protein S18 acetylase RimI-like enzyme